MARQKSLFPLSQETGSVCVVGDGESGLRTIEAPAEGKGNYVRAWSCRKPDLAFCEPEGAWHKFSLSSFPEEKLKGSMMGEG